MDEHRNFEGEPIPIKYYSKRIFNIFEDWFYTFNDVYDNGVDDNDDTQIFIQNFFKAINTNTETLIELYKFGASNEISLLCNTVAYNMRNLNVVQNLIFDTQKQQILQISTELSNLINEWKTKKYNDENNYRNLFIEHRRFNVYRKGSLVERKEIPAKMFLILYKLWIKKGIDFVKTDDFKTLCQLFNVKIGVESIHNSNNKMDLDDFKIIQRLVPENGDDMTLKNTFKEFINAFRAAIFELNDTEIEMMNSFLSNLLK